VPTRGLAGVATCANAAEPVAGTIATAHAAATNNFMMKNS
jgi:hypothetical protein